MIRFHFVGSYCQAALQRGGLLLLIALPVVAGQDSKKSPLPVESCVYASRFFKLNSYDAHGITCQQCVRGGKWQDVGGQYCAASKPQRLVGSHAKPKAHVCAKEGNTYSLGAVYYDGADDCSRCEDRSTPNDWDALDKIYFCENTNPDASAALRRLLPEFDFDDLALVATSARSERSSALVLPRPRGAQQ